MKNIITSLSISFFICVSFLSEAQLLNKLKNKVNSKISAIESKKKEESFGTANIQHSNYGEMAISKLSKTKLIKDENSSIISGSWWTHEADVFDGYTLEIDSEEVTTGSYSIGENINFTLAYDPAKLTDRAVSLKYQKLEFTSGKIDIESIEESSFILKFNGKGVIDGNQVEIRGSIQTDLVEMFDQRRKKISKNHEDEDADESSTSAYTSAMSKYMNRGSSSASTDVRDKYVFSHRIEHEVITSNSKERLKMDFLLTNDGDYSGISVNMSDYNSEGSGESLIVTDGEEVHIFVNTGGMKMRLSQMPGGSGNLPTQDFSKPEGTEMKKTGASKKILGYTCYEYIVKDENMDAQFWVTPDLKVKNWMNFDSGEIDGHVLEFDVSTKEGDSKSIATNIDVDANIIINTSEYRKF